MVASGRLIDIADFKAEDVCLSDIAHHLSRIQRFIGSLPVDVSYSVGEHSINMAKYFMGKGLKAFPAYAILHDASEAYLSDLASPIKEHLPDYKALESRVQSVIYKKYLGVDEVCSTELKDADKRIVLDEVLATMPENIDKYKKVIPFEPLGAEIEYNNHPGTTKMCFLTLCNELGIKD
jgi:hypothetical protein